MLGFAALSPTYMNSCTVSPAWQRRTAKLCFASTGDEAQASSPADHPLFRFTVAVSKRVSVQRGRRNIDRAIDKLEAPLIRIDASR
jgi:hypothetical protein